MIRRWALAFILCCATLGANLYAQATLASAKPPLYPLTARAAGIEGSVVLKATITKEGKVRDLQVISGPPELQQAAINAVYSWTYHPYTHFGHLVEVDTTVTVNFKMGKGKEKADVQAKAQAELDKLAQPSSETLQTPPPKS